ncbi:MAG: response regulator [Candidatus Methanofastidiosum sp.]|nr:response regulator [Methanofastidiosum sp.]
MMPLIKNNFENMAISEENVSRESLILDLIPGIIHQINNSLASVMVSIELLQKEMINLRKQSKEESINILLLDHLEKLALLNKDDNPKNKNILMALIKEEILKLKDQCEKKNIDNTKFDYLDNLISLNMKSAKRIDSIAKAFRRLVSFEKDVTLIDVNEVVSTSLIILQNHLKNKFTIREDYSELSLVNFNFYQLNYTIICILLKIIELMDSGELNIKTFETDNNIHVNIKLMSGQISKESLDVMANNTTTESKIDLCSIKKLLQHTDGIFDITRSLDIIENESINGLSGEIAFNIKIKKNDLNYFNLDSTSQNNLDLEDISLNNIGSDDSNPGVNNFLNNENVNSRNILVVDDDPQTLVSLFLSLKNQELANRIIIAKTAEAGIEQFKEKDFCLVISDYKLPGMDGISFLNHIKEKYPNTQRVLITGFLNSTIKEDATNKASIKHIIEKPWTTPDLLNIVQDALTQYK